MAHDLYHIEAPLSGAPLSHKIDLLTQADATARAFDRRIREVQVGVHDEIKYVMIATSDGRLVGDVQPLTRLGMTCIADDDGNRQVGRGGGGGRVGIEFFEGAMTPEAMARDVAQQAIIQLEAGAAPAGTMEGGVGAGWPG